MMPRTIPRMPAIVAALNRRRARLPVPVGRVAEPAARDGHEGAIVDHDAVQVDARTAGEGERAARESGREHRTHGVVGDVAELGVRPDGQGVLTVVDEVDVLGATLLAVLDAARISDRDHATAGEQHHGRRQPSCRRTARHESDGEQAGGLRVGDRERRAALRLPQPLHDERPDADRGGEGSGEREQRQQGGAEAAATRGCRERFGAGAGPSPGARAGIRQIDDDLTQR